MNKPKLCQSCQITIDGKKIRVIKAARPRNLSINQDGSQTLDVDILESEEVDPECKEKFTCLDVLRVYRCCEPQKQGYYFETTSVKHFETELISVLKNVVRDLFFCRVAEKINVILTVDEND